MSNILIDRVKRLSAEAMDLLETKNDDYAYDNDPYSNFKMIEQLGVTDMRTAIFVRMLDKVSRAAKLLKSNEASVDDESIVDTLLDLSNYALILASTFEEDNKKTSQNTANTEQSPYIYD